MTLQLWHIKLVGLLLVLTSLFFWHKYEVKTAVNQAVAVQKAQYDKIVEDLKVRSLETESKLNRQVLDMEIKKNAQIKDIDRKYRSAIDSLRQRPERSTESNTSRNSCNTESPGEIDSERLFGRHAEISLGIARDAEELKTHLNACYRQYDALKDQLDKFKDQ